MCCVDERHTYKTGCGHEKKKVWQSKKIFFSLEISPIIIHLCARSREEEGGGGEKAPAGAILKSKTNENPRLKWSELFCSNKDSTRQKNITVQPISLGTFGKQLFKVENSCRQ